MDKQIKSMLSKYSNIINKKNIDINELNKVKKSLKICLSNDAFPKDTCYIFLGKIYLKLNQVNEAEEYYLNAFKLNSNLPSIYYGLFKIKVIKNEISSAYVYLKKYEYYLKQKNKNYILNLDDYYFMIKVLLNEKTDEINKNNLSNNVVIKDEYLLEKYNKFIELLEGKNYIEAKKYLIECQNYIKNTNIPLDFNTHILLLNSVIKKENKLSYNNILNLMKECSNLIDSNDYNNAEIFIENTKNIDRAHIYSKEIKYLETKSNDLKIYKNLDDLKKEQINNYINLGRKLNHNELYNDALNIYNEAYNKTNYNLFFYYIGKMYYKLNDYTASERFLKYYNSVGVLKYNKSRLYLIKIYQKKKQFNKRIN